MKIDASNILSKNIVIYGAQQYFIENIDKINFKIKYLFPAGKVDLSNPLFKKYTILKTLDEIKRIDNVFVLIARGLVKDVESISELLCKNNISFDHMGNYTSNTISMNYLKAMNVDDYTDQFNNQIVFEKEAKIEKLIFSRMSSSKNNFIRIGKVICKRSSNIAMVGDAGTCEIGDGTSIEQIEIIINSTGTVKIGKDCMFSYGITLMQTDHHHIFDLSSGKRINYSKNINIGNHVWIGREVELLAGAEIGNNSIVGARSVSSGKFGSNCIIAGAPARVVRENIIWAEDPIRKGSLDYFEQAVDKRGIKYL